MEKNQPNWIKYWQKKPYKHKYIWKQVKKHTKKIANWTENKKLTHGKKTNKSFLFSDRKVTNLLFLIRRQYNDGCVNVCMRAAH